MSPVIHTAAFRHHGLPYTYEIRQTSTVDELVPLISSSSFGGSSVTMPHKLQISKYCDETTDHAKRIGAVNTLIVSQDPVSRQMKIVGDNTDWSGLVECVKVKGREVISFAKTGLVIGAGGASRAALYALYQSGVENIHLVNRTRATSEQIARDYSSLFSITVLSSLYEVGKPSSRDQIS
jgi:shikimate 5-dehydrogenase